MLAPKFEEILGLRVEAKIAEEEKKEEASIKKE